MSKKHVYILAIESSCDDTAVAVLKNKKVLSNIVANQKIHKQYGGVVPELASRAHQKNIIPIVEIALKESNVNKNQLNAIAFTKGPGLLGSLLVGVNFAKSLALSLGIPCIEVNHMHAHILSHFIENNKIIPNFPYLCLTVSGGHTQLVIVKNYSSIEIIGKTLDDAAGEAFDKTAKILGIEYPGGPLMDKYAKNGNHLKFNFSKSKVPELNFSFSGIKTNVLYFVKDQLKIDKNFIENNLKDLCASIQHTIIEMLTEKLIVASKKTKINNIAISGGVAANSYLRNQLKKLAEKYNWKIFIPKTEYCTDNAAMIGLVAYLKYLNNQFSKINSTAKARLNF